MPYDSNGNATVNRQVAVPGQTILAPQVNVPFDDIQSMLSQVLLRSGVAPLAGNLSASGFRITNAADGSADGDYVTVSQLSAVIATVTAGVVPTGAVAGFRMTTPPAGWIKENGGTIGSAASGATNRANADTEALFTLLWNNFNQATLPIQNSAGAVTTRGANAAADFAAAKRMPLFDARSRFPRGADDGLGYDASIIVGFAQDDEIKSHTHTVNDPGHSHTQTRPRQVVDADRGGSPSVWSIDEIQAIATSADLTGITLQNFGGSETRPRALAELRCIKL